MSAPDHARRRRSTNGDLIGKPGSRALLDTPALMVDATVLRQNIDRAAVMVKASGKSLSPHLKAHKTPKIAELQRTAGASGFCVASIGEAEVFAAAGFDGLTITSTFATDRQIARIAKLAQKINLTVVVDNPAIVGKLAEASVMAKALVDVDMGRGRSACRTEAMAVALVLAISDAPSLTFDGLQCYAGQLSHMTDFANRRDAAARADARAQAFLGAVRSVSLGPLRCSGGSTGASTLDLQSKALTDLQWGSYAIMDVEYALVEASADAAQLPFAPALRVATRVISVGHPDHVMVDAGDKRFASKYGAAPQIVSDAYAGCIFRAASDEHGEIRGVKLPALGEIVEVVPPHCDPTINLFDDLHVTEGDKLIDIWPVAARGVY